VSEVVVVHEPGRPDKQSDDPQLALEAMKKPWLAAVLVLRGRGRRFARLEGLRTAGKMVFL
jgi:hypothetical protein